MATIYLGCEVETVADLAFLLGTLSTIAPQRGIENSRVDLGTLNFGVSQGSHVTVQFDTIE